MKSNCSKHIVYYNTGCRICRWKMAEGYKGVREQYEFFKFSTALPFHPLQQEKEME